MKYEKPVLHDFLGGEASGNPCWSGSTTADCSNGTYPTYCNYGSGYNPDCTGGYSPDRTCSSGTNYGCYHGVGADQGCGQGNYHTQGVDCSYGYYADAAPPPAGCGDGNGVY